MGSFFPDEPKKLKERISRYRRALKTDLSDGAGKRFLVGPMYLLLGDIDGAIGYYDWYSEAFPDDGPEPFNHLSWALSLYKVGRMVDAATKIRQTMFSNLYLVPHLLGVKPQALKIWHGSNWAELDYAMDLPEDLLGLWDHDAKAWAKSVYNDPATSTERARFIEIEAQLLDAAPGPSRSALVREAFKIREGKAALVLVPASEELS